MTFRDTFYVNMLETIYANNTNEMPYGLRMAQKRFRSKPFERKRMVATFEIHKQSKQIFFGENRHKTHPLAKRFGHLHDRTHAELDAIIGARRDSITASGTIYVYREKADGEMGLASPCKSCRALLKNQGVERVVYSIPGGYVTEYI